MNFQGLDKAYVEKNRSNQTYRSFFSNQATPPTTAGASQVTVLHAPLPHTLQHQEQSSPSTLPTVVPYVPSPPSTPEIYGPDRFFGHQIQPRALTYNAAVPVTPRPLVHFDEQPLIMAAPHSNLGMADFKDELVRGVGQSVTPGVDDTPFIQYALEALTRPREDSRGVSELHSSGSSETNPMYRYLPTAVPGLFNPAPVHLAGGQQETTLEEELAALRAQRRTNLEEMPRYDPDIVQRRDSSGTVRMPFASDSDQDGDLDDTPDELDRLVQAPSSKRHPRDVAYWQAQPDRFRDPEKAERNPPLTHRPWILSTWSLLMLAILCVSMITALIFCAIYSNRHNGLLAYSGTIYGGQYFVFRILPQLLAAVLLLYAQNVILATFRILPFSAMASDDLRTRRNVEFLPLYPKSFLWPQLVSTWHIWIPIVILWIMNLTIPLQSCLFTVVYIDQVWIWSTVQGVAWVLVALYVSLLLSTGLLIAYWHNRRTGLLPSWDMRSMADIISLLAQSNSLEQHAGTEKATSRNEIRHIMYGNLERLGYWFAPEAPDNHIWYGIGVPTNEEKIDISLVGPPIHEREPRARPLHGAVQVGDAHLQYLPWCFRDSQMLLWLIASAVLVIALFVVCFNRSTDVREGFLPLLAAAPVPGAFSAANFLYSFIPSLLGMIVFLLFQSMDLTLRILTPWGELSRKDGSRASRSILLDYAACLPFEATWKALRNRHWRVAAVSLLATLLILLPVLAGGLFMALTPPSGVVRMFPNVPTLAMLLALLTLMVVALASLILGRNQYRLPHAVTCLAEIISFCYDDNLRTDPAFDMSQSHRFLKGRLGTHLAEDRESRWYLGTGYNRRERFGIKRLGKFTGDTTKVRYQNKSNSEGPRSAAPNAVRRIISRPVVKGSSTMIGP